MGSIEERLKALIEDYRPARLLIVGDLVHDRSVAQEASALTGRLGESCETIVIAGNHDRQLGSEVRFLDSWESERFHFHHGHCAAETAGKIQIIGHHHPAATLRDGAGLHLKYPALVQTDGCWILPAFSPWSAGTAWKPSPASRVWICTPTRVFPLQAREPASA
ncbi:MAG: metallophosphoesterase [Verrucomicrobiota bacterium]